MMTEFLCEFKGNMVQQHQLKYFFSTGVKQ